LRRAPAEAGSLGYGFKPLPGSYLGAMTALVDSFLATLSRVGVEVREGVPTGLKPAAECLSASMGLLDVDAV
jgi:hypothetical protein